MLARLQTSSLGSPASGRAHGGERNRELTGHETMAGYADEEHDRARRFRDAALPHLDDVFTLARYLMRNATDAEDAVQECYLRALRHFDSYRGPAMKPWLLTILRQHDDDTIRKLLGDLPQQFREIIVLREINDLSYQEIAQVAGVPVGTVMSRLARARSMLRSAWNVAEGAAS
jgi:RNA polymerase sigma-70 factor (ECF subfamily)